MIHLENTIYNHTLQKKIHQHNLWLIIVMLAPLQLTNTLFEMLPPPFGEEPKKSPTVFIVGDFSNLL